MPTYRYTQSALGSVPQCPSPRPPKTRARCLFPSRPTFSLITNQQLPFNRKEAFSEVTHVIQRGLQVFKNH